MSCASTSISWSSSFAACPLLAAMPPSRGAGFAFAGPGLEKRLLSELAAIAQDIRPSTDEKSLPGSVAEYRTGQKFEQRVWRQYALGSPS